MARELCCTAVTGGFLVPVCPFCPVQTRYYSQIFRSALRFSRHKLQARRPFGQISLKGGKPRFARPHVRAAREKHLVIGK